MILVTGGLGYVGSHACVELLRAGESIVVYDNLSNSRRSVLERIRRIQPGAIDLIEGDLRDEAALRAAFAKGSIEAVLHFAGLKQVEESTRKPLEYQDVNVVGTQRLVNAALEHGISSFVFSSSAVVYGPAESPPIAESHPLNPQSPYGHGKQQVEELLTRASASQPDFHHASLRYFNPAGAHPSALIGEDPTAPPTNLMPVIMRVATGAQSALQIFGNDYATADGTTVRDYIHVMDVAAAHVSALTFLRGQGRSLTANIGTGRGHTVLELVAAFEKVAGAKVSREFAARREGDIVKSFADCGLAARELKWKAARSIEEMCRDAWRWELCRQAAADRAVVT